MAGPVIRLDGVSRLVRTMKAAEVDVDELKAATVAAGQLAAAAIAAEAPVGPTGRLRASVRGNRAARRAVVSAGRASLPYGPPVHWGWRAHGIEPNEFGPRGLERAEPAIAAGYVREIERILDDVKGA